MARRKAAFAGTLVFVHANGFPAGTYERLFAVWRQAGWRVLAPPKLGHDPRFHVTSNWPHIRDELITFIDAEAARQPVHLVGHSLGGYLSLLVAARQPERVAGIVLVDSPVLAGWRAHTIQMAKLTGLMRRVSPGRVSQTRRQHWDSLEQAYAHYAAKSVFARWDAQVLRDYVACGIETDPAGGVRLAFRRDIETRLYNTLPHHLAPLLKKHPPSCAVGFVGGTQSSEVRQVGMAATRAVTRGRILWIEGTHLFPMEKPLEAARAVLTLLEPPH